MYKLRRIVYIAAGMELPVSAETCTSIWGFAVAWGMCVVYYMYKLRWSVQTLGRSMYTEVECVYTEAECVHWGSYLILECLY